MVETQFRLRFGVKNTGDIPLDFLVTAYIYNAQHTTDTWSFKDSSGHANMGETVPFSWTGIADLSVGDWVGVVQVWNSDKTKKLAETNTSNSMPVSGTLGAQILNLIIEKV